MSRFRFKVVGPRLRSRRRVDVRYVGPTPTHLAGGDLLVDADVFGGVERRMSCSHLIDEDTG